MSPKQRKELTVIFLQMVLFLAIGLSTRWIGWNPVLLMACYLLLYLWISWKVLKKTLKNIRNLDFMDENFLMSVASIGAFCLQEYMEAIAVMLFYRIGEWFEHYAIDKSRRNISQLMDIAPEYANVSVDGKIEKMNPEDVKVGDLIYIYPGERVPLDGVVVEGNSYLDTAALTGESVPQTVHPGDAVISGCINQNSVLQVRTTKTYENSTVSRILELVENATDKKSRSEQFITKFARIYTPVVVYSALTLAILGSFITKDPSTWIYRALEFLVISCPCALVISVPLSFFGGIGAASKCGILVKGSTYLQEMAGVKTMVFDKTGTLTKGTFDVTAVHSFNLSKEHLLELAAKVESFSSHPIAQSIVKAANPINPQQGVSDVQEISGKGMSALVDGNPVSVGNAALMEQLGISSDLLSSENSLGTIVYVAVDGKYQGWIEVADEPKEDAAVVMDLLRTDGVNRFVMLTGDRMTTAQVMAKRVGIDEVHAKLLPGQKVAELESILAGSKGVTAYIGDGINDAPVLTRSDIGIAMGALGSDAAIEAADIVLMDDQLSSLVVLMAIARKTLSVAKANIIFAITVKVLMLVLGALGIVNMWGAVFADVGVTILCVLNAGRMLSLNRQKIIQDAFASCKACSTLKE